MCLDAISTLIWFFPPEIYESTANLAIDLVCDQAFKSDYSEVACMRELLLRIRLGADCYKPYVRFWVYDVCWYGDEMQ
jgi:hypothetical protein